MIRRHPISTLFPYRRSSDLTLRLRREVRPGARVTTAELRKAARRDARTISAITAGISRSEEHTSELQSLAYLVCRLLLEKKNFLSPLSSSDPAVVSAIYHLL